MSLPDKKLASQIDDITIKSIDKSVINWFDVDYPCIVNGKKIPVIYATAERWARAQKEKGFRDESGVLTLPLISIRRTIPAHRKERFASIADETNITLVKRIATTPISNNDKQPAIYQVTQANPKKDETVYEIVQIPFPSFVNLNYEVVVWTSYMTHQNLAQENIYKEFAGGRQYFKVDDYFFFGTLGTSTDHSNLSEFSKDEKIIKYSFSLVIEAFFINKTKIKTYRTSNSPKIRMTETSYPLK